METCWKPAGKIWGLTAARPQAAAKRREPIIMVYELVGAKNLLEELLAEHVWFTRGVPGYKRNASRQEILADATVPATWSDEPLQETLRRSHVPCAIWGMWMICRRTGDGERLINPRRLPEPRG